jgi:hypothetical protein
VPAAHRILIVAADCGSVPNVLRNNLLAQSGVGTVDFFNSGGGGSGTPDLALLQQYDTVVAYSNCPFVDPVTLGNNLVAYMQGGGVVVAFNFSWASGASIQGAWLSGNYSPFNTPGTNNFVNGTLGTCTNAQICSGVNTLSASNRQTLTVAAGATLAGTWNDGTPLMAYKGQAVGVSAYVGDFSCCWSGDFARIILNAANWLGHVPCASPTPSSTTPTQTITNTPTYTPSHTPTNTPTITPTDNPTNTPTAVAPAGMIVGHLTWQGITQPNVRNAGITGTLSLCVGGVPQSYSTSTDASGFFTVTTGLADGMYNWSFKGQANLGNAGTLAISAGSANQEMGLQRAGDCNNSNVVNATDFSVLRATFGTGNDLRADFNRDGVVNATDFNLLRSNFGQGGSTLVCP